MPKTIRSTSNIYAPQEAVIILYHRTTEANAEEILRNGFRDVVGNYGMTRPSRGVWLSDVPLDFNEGAKGDILLRVELPEQAIATYELIEDGKPYREWQIPAQLVNKLGKIRIIEDGHRTP